MLVYVNKKHVVVNQNYRPNPSPNVSIPMSLYEGSTGGASDEVADEKEVDDSNGGEGKSCANQSTGTRRLPEVGGAVKLPSIGVGRQRCLRTWVLG